jgi:hypothetical protein
MPRTAAKEGRRMGTAGAVDETAARRASCRAKGASRPDIVMCMGM